MSSLPSSASSISSAAGVSVTASTSSRRHVGPELDAVADGAEFRRAFEHARGAAAPRQRQRRGEAAEPAADNQDRIAAGHRLRLRHVHIDRGRLSQFRFTANGHRRIPSSRPQSAAKGRHCMSEMPRRVSNSQRADELRDQATSRIVHPAAISSALALPIVHVMAPARTHHRSIGFHGPLVRHETP